MEEPGIFGCFASDSSVEFLALLFSRFAAFVLSVALYWVAVPQV